MVITSKRRPAAVTARPSTRLSSYEDRLVDMVRPVGLPALRISLGVVFVWFGALKAVRDSAVEPLVAAAVPWVDPAFFVPFLGVFEVAIGAALLVGRRLTLVSAIMVAHLVGTFVVVLTAPEMVFRDGNPLLLTTEGQFLVKNFVMISAGIVLLYATRPSSSPVPSPRTGT